MPQMKYNFLKSRNTNPPSVELEKVPDTQFFGYPKGQDFHADVQHCTEIFQQATSFYKDEPNAEHNKKEMITAFQAMGVPIPFVK